MKKSVVIAALAAFVLPISASISVAGPIERACLNSNQKAANRAVCSCIQQVADMTLRGADQRKAAKVLHQPG